MGISSIQWTDVTDNIIVAVDDTGAQRGWWCHKISPGCANCYAEEINDSDYFKGNHLPYSGAPPLLKLREDIIDGWVRKKKTKKHFVMSMSDVFGEWVPRAWIFRFLDGMRAAARQIFQVLTKRANVMLREVLAWLEARGLNEVPANIWLGVSVENQKFADERIPFLLQIPVPVRFLSVEPMLGGVDIRAWLSALHWVIVGGEGRGGRRCEVTWVRSVVAQCAAAGVPVFVKQLGSYIVDGNDAGFEGDEPDHWPIAVSREDRIKHLDPQNAQNFQGAPVRIHLKKKGGEPEFWPADLQVRQFPEVARAA